MARPRDFKYLIVRGGEIATGATSRGFVMLDVYETPHGGLAGVTLTYKQAYRLASALMQMADLTKKKTVKR